jgi:hypothetical protein
MLMIVAVLSTGLLAGCGGTTTTATATVTTTVAGAGTTQTVTTTRTNTVTTTAAGATVTQTVGAGETAYVTVTTTVTTGDGGSDLITVMNPDVANHMVERIPLTPRLDSIEGKRIYLMDVNWGSGDEHGAYSFLGLVGDWLEAEYNCICTLKKKNGAYFSGDPDLFQEASENADAVIFGISG